MCTAKEKDGQITVLGVPTLEPMQDQAETLARARQSGTLSAEPRPTVDVNRVENATDDQAPKRFGSIGVVRYGVQSATTTQK
jgi:pilus assembly protein CpaB